MADEDDRLPVRFEAVHDREELVRFLRREHGGRLVEDQDVCASIERLQDLDALLLTDGDLADERRRVDDEAEPLRELPHTPLGAPLVEQKPVARLDPEHDVLGDRHHGDEHEVLVHHADPRGDRIARRAERDRLSVQQNLARIRAVETVEDVHERRLAGAVLA